MPELSPKKLVLNALLKRNNAFLFSLFTLKRRMSIKTRSKSQKESEMSATEGKFDAVLTKSGRQDGRLVKGESRTRSKVEFHSSETREP